MSRAYRIVAGNLELFCGAYFVALGTLASIYFTQTHRTHLAMIAAGAAVVGLFLIVRASRLLAWRRWLFWTVAVALMFVPIGWLIWPLVGR